MAEMAVWRAVIRVLARCGSCDRIPPMALRRALRGGGAQPFGYGTTGHGCGSVPDRVAARTGWLPPARGPPAAGRGVPSGGLAGGDEVVQEPAELPLDVDIAVRPPHQAEPAVRRQPRPDAAARQVERDRDPCDQQQERDPDQALP